ncbi:MAG TPA: transposase [Thiobacillaceae bacterium]|nr:transposase [Thiobacillaceae bacterium]
MKPRCGATALTKGKRRSSNTAHPAQDRTHRRSRRKGEVNEIARAKNRNRSRVRAKVEHAYGVIKNIFGFVKLRYKGLTKNATRLFATYALANISTLARHYS